MLTKIGDRKLSKSMHNHTQMLYSSGRPLEGANHRFEYYVEVAGSDANQVAGELPGEGTPEDFQMEFFISDEGVEQSNVLLPILVIGLVIFIIYGAGQMVGNRGGKAKL